MSFYIVTPFSQPDHIVPYHLSLNLFCPTIEMEQLYKAKPGTNKAFLTAEGAGHAKALYLLGDKYWETVFDFIDQYME